jgi:hypothetical protein
LIGTYRTHQIIVFIPNQAETEGSSHKLEIFSLIGCSSIFISIFNFDKTLPYPSYYTLLPTLGTALIIRFCNQNTIVGKVLSHKVPASVGLISYSAYLFHQPLFAFSRITSLGPLTELNISVIIVITLCLSCITYKIIETPYRNKNFVSVQTLFASGMIFFMVFSFFVVFLFNGRFHESNKSQVAVINSNSSQTHHNNIKTKFISTLNVTLAPITTQDMNKFSDKMPDSNLFVFEESEFRYKCHNYDQGQKEAVFCPVGKNNTTQPVYLLYGDSLSLALVSAFDAFNVTGAFTSATHGCRVLPTKDEDYLEAIRHGKQHEDCYKLPYDMIKFLKRTPSINRVYLAVNWMLNADRLSTDLNYTLKILTDFKLKVYLVQQVPEQPIRGPQLYQNLFNKGQLSNENLRKNSLSREEYNKQQAGVLQEFEKLKKNYKNVEVIYIQDAVCDDKFCPVGTVTEPYVFDTSHLTRLGAKVVKPKIEKYINY